MKIKPKNTTAKTIAIAVLGIILLFIQNNIKAPFSFLTGVNFLIPFMVCVGLYCGHNIAIWFGLGAGIILDCFSSGIIAFNAITFIIIGYFSAVALDKFFNMTFKSALALSGISSLFYYIVFGIVFKLNNVDSILYYFVHNGLKGFIISFLCIIPVYFIFLVIEKLFVKEERKWQQKKMIQG